MEELNRLCGTDLTVYDPINKFWHTGFPTNAEVGDVETKQPQKYMWRVTAGTSGGKGPPGKDHRRKAQPYRRYAEHFQQSHMFKNRVD